MNSQDPKIIFLHIPKTAGQSVHAALVKAYGKDAVCPARVNHQLRNLSIRELNSYKVFSGHLDWSMLDCITGPKYVFTILREPMDRILSFYFYLRDQAAKFSPEERELPQHRGMKAAYESSPKEYFTGGAPQLRKFLDDHYDNFYSYFFAGRHYAARGQLVESIRRGELTSERVLEMAVDNLSSIDAVFTVDNMKEVFSTIQRLSGSDQEQVEDVRVNVNKNVAAGDRMSRLKALGADEVTLAKLNEYCALDRELWRRCMDTRRTATSDAVATCG